MRPSATRAIPAGGNSFRVGVGQGERVPWAGAIFLGLSFLLSPGASAQRTQLKPGWNMFTPQQDIEVGKRASVDAQKLLPLCNAPKVDAYLTQLGTRLAQKLPAGGVQYPFEFHCVNDKAINAFCSVTREARNHKRT